MAGDKQLSSLLALDIGSVTTRAHYFDLVEGKYRFIAGSEALSGVGLPYGDISMGALDALRQIEQVTGRNFFSEDGTFIYGEEEDQDGGETIVSTFSGGPPLRVIALGLLDGVSLKSVKKLVNSHYCEIVGQFSLSDRQPEKLVDAVTQEMPDLIVIAGGTNRGASRSVMRLANYLVMALELLDWNERPELLFVGNESLQSEMESLLGAVCELHFASNIRPSLDEELLGPASKKLGELFFRLQSKKVRGLDQIRDLSNGGALPTATAFGRAIRFLSRVIDYPKGMLGIDLGAASTTVAAAFGGQLSLSVYPGLGMGSGIEALLEKTEADKLSRWMSEAVPDSEVFDHLQNKLLAPQSLPTAEVDITIEQAAAREVLRMAMERSLGSFPKDVIYPLAGSPPWFDRILITGNSATHAPRQVQSLLMVLDAVQPVGVATIILDQHNLISAVGASAESNPLLAVQILESNSFVNLGTVISPVGKASEGSAILRIQIIRDGNKEPIVEIAQGKLQSIPIPERRAVDVYVYPLQNMDIGLGPGTGVWVRRVVGGKYGLIVDARGRPLHVPNDVESRINLLKDWQHSLVETQN